MKDVEMKTRILSDDTEHIDARDIKIKLNSMGNTLLKSIKNMSDVSGTSLIFLVCKKAYEMLNDDYPITKEVREGIKVVPIYKIPDYNYVGRLGNAKLYYTDNDDGKICATFNYNYMNNEKIIE